MFLIQRRRVVFISVKFEYVQTPRANPLGGNSYEVEDIRNCPSCICASAKQVSLIICMLDAADDQPTGRGGCDKQHSGDLDHVHFLLSQLNGYPLLVRDLSYLPVARSRATGTNIKPLGIRFHNLNDVFLVGGCIGA